ncbi:unnamed protein product [Parajaminaea phylloscopi]
MGNVAFEPASSFARSAAESLKSLNEMQPGKESVARKQARMPVELPNFGKASMFSFAAALYRGFPVALVQGERGSCSMGFLIRTGQSVCLAPGVTLLNELISDLSPDRKAVATQDRAERRSLTGLFRFRKRSTADDWTRLRGPEDTCRFNWLKTSALIDKML